MVLATHDIGGDLAFGEAVAWFHRHWDVNNPDDPMLSPYSKEFLPVIIIPSMSPMEMAEDFCEVGNLKQLQLLLVR